MYRNIDFAQFESYNVGVGPRIEEERRGERRARRGWRRGEEAREVRS